MVRTLTIVDEIEQLMCPIYWIMGRAFPNINTEVENEI